MQDIIMSQEISDVDLSKIAALQQKRTLAFVNHFVITTVQFLNNFSKRCEQRLMVFERKIEKINATMVLLEAKLSSISELNNTALETSSHENTSQVSETETQKEVIEETTTELEQKNCPEIETKAAITAKEEDIIEIKPEYEKFVKMVQVGVPAQAVKLKISLEGLDPSELDKINVKNIFKQDYILYK